MHVMEGLIAPENPKQRRVVLTFATRFAIGAYGEGEVDMIDVPSLDLSLLNSGRAPLLADHTRLLDNVLGVIESAWIDGNAAWALAQFGTTERANTIWTLVQERVICNVSMGCVYPDAAEGSGALRRARPFEVSLVTVPANWRCMTLTAPQEDLAVAAKAAEARRQQELQEAVELQRRRGQARLVEATAPRLASALGTNPALTAAALAAALEPEPIGA